MLVLVQQHMMKIEEFTVSRVQIVYQGTQLSSFSSVNEKYFLLFFSIIFLDIFCAQLR